jgi:N utilization substance protein B
LAALCHLEHHPMADRKSLLERLWTDPPTGDGLGEEHFATLVSDPQARSFATQLVHFAVDEAATIDALIEQTSSRWRLSRMDQIDRNILRLVVAELRSVEVTPRPVVLAEAVRLASSYGSERSSTFVNGLAEALARVVRPEAPPK